VRPIPVIVAAQALNGVLLPCVAVFLALAVNDRRRLGEGGSNGAVANGLLAVVVGVCALLGTSTAVRAGAALLGLPASPEPPLLAAGLVAGVALAGWVLVAVRRESRR
jgi:Mn2+/Fe2+ NRAMP family transporter